MKNKVRSFLMTVLFACVLACMAAGVSAEEEKTSYFKNTSQGTFYIHNGRALTGARYINGKPFYFYKESDKGQGRVTGQMAVGLQKINGQYYYFYPGTTSTHVRGQMATGFAQVPASNGKSYATMYFYPSGRYLGQAAAGGMKKLDGKTYCFSNAGILLTGFRVLNGKAYYFAERGTARGQMSTGWQNIQGGRYYFQPTGAMATGVAKISGNVYYFRPSGKSIGQMQTGLIKANNGKTYYFGSSGAAQSGWHTLNNTIYYFDPETYEMDSSKTRPVTELETLCNSIVSRVVNSGDSRDVKLSKLFQYVAYNYSYSRVTWGVGVPGWSRTYALNMLKAGAGSCYSYASAYAYLVKAALPDLDVRVGWGSTPAAGGGLTPHGWCEINIGGTWFVFDPDLYRYVYYGSCYYQTMGQVGGYYYNRSYETAVFG